MTDSSLSRRSFIGTTLAVTASTALLDPLALAAQKPQPAPKPAPRQFDRKIKLGLIGCGGRGSLIAKLAAEHGGYEFHAVCDYFPEHANKAGDAHNVPANRRFSTLSGYKKLLESGVEAVLLETPAFFFPEHATAAIAAGVHVYMAKPVAVDVPGALAIEAAGKAATGKNRVFLVDYQMPTDPTHIQIRDRINAGAIGKIAYVRTRGCCNFPNPKLPNLESKLAGLKWIYDTVLGCGLLGNFDIHAIDAALWVIGQRPVSAMAHSRICRPDPQGDTHDTTHAIFTYANGLSHAHEANGLKNLDSQEGLRAIIGGEKAYAVLNYWGKSMLRGGDKSIAGESGNGNLYDEGIKSNLATFYDCITTSKFDNPTVGRAVDGVLACILAREAGIRQTTLAMDALIKENRKLELDLSSLKS